jgi:aryl-alcohol dehydrogenase-like predicted oxidoreductase
VEVIGLYQFHRADPKVAYADSVGALAELLDEGVIRMAGISNAETVMIDTAQEVLGGRLVSVQNQFSPRHATAVAYNELKHTVGLGLAFLPWSPLGGISSASKLGSRHAAFQEIADARGVSPQRVTLAWLLALDEHIIPIPGSSRPETITDSAGALELELSADEVQRLSAAVGIA